MKKLLALVVLVILLVMSSPAFASANSKSVRLNRIAVFSDYSDVDTIVNVENNLGSKLKGAHITIVIPELGIRKRVGPLNIDSGDEITRMLMLDTYGAEPGEYCVRITVSNDNIRRVRHRFITI